MDLGLKGHKDIFVNGFLLMELVHDGLVLLGLLYKCTEAIKGVL